MTTPARVIVGLLAIFTSFCFPQTATAVPADFERIPLVSSGLSSPTAIEFAPDGRLFILEQGGAIKIYKNGRLNERFFDELPAYANSDRGLLGIAFDPDFSTNHYVYFYYIDLAAEHRVVRYNAAGDIGTDGPVTIWESNTVAGSNHAGGTIQFGPDGKLYISVGDSGNPPNAQNLGNPMGKILRINKDGTIPADNPFVSDPVNRGEIWAYGLRNPFRFQFDSLTGELYLGDVGGEKYEEVNTIVKGGNYGWPLAEGACTSCSYLNPLYAYAHPTPSYSITGGPLYRHSQFPAIFRGSYLYGDYAAGFIKYLTLDADGQVVENNAFESAAGTVVDMKVAPDGSLYYVTIFPGRLYRITYVPGNKTPIAHIGATPQSGTEPLTVQFSSAGSTDPEGAALTYLWNLGDGTTSTEPNPTHIYSAAGVYTVNLTVSDGEKTATSFPLTISVGTPPTVTIDTPANGSLYQAGDTISYLVSATDRHGATIPSGQISVEAVFHHSTHVHPFLRPTTGASGSFTIPRTGETSPDTWYELRATATDADGLTLTVSHLIHPEKTTYTLTSTTAGAKILMDGSPVTLPYTAQGVIGSERLLDAYTQKIGNLYYEFASWSDGGGKKHTVTLPSEPVTYTAAFTLSPPFTGQYFSNNSFSGTPVLTREDPVVNFAWGSGSPDPSLPSDNFSVRWTKQQYFYYGRYKFSGFSDDGIRVYLDGNLVLNGWGYNRGVSSILDIPEGLHDLRVDYYEGGGGADVGFSWDLTPDQPSPTPSPSATPLPSISPSPSPSLIPSPLPSPEPSVLISPPPSPVPSPSAGMWRAEYYDNQTLSGVPRVVRNEGTIQNTWNSSSPDSLIPSDLFSARWSRTAHFDGGVYQFRAVADDGVRVYLDGVLIIDKWKDQPATLHTSYQYLSPGDHQIVMEYYEAYGGAVARLAYTVMPDVFAGEYFSNITLTGSPALIRADSSINFLWNDPHSPSILIPQDNFSARWSTWRYFPTTKEYRFTVKSDDGIRVYIDNELVHDDWTDHPLRTAVIRKTLATGVHNIRVEYYERTGGAIASFHQDN